MVGKYSFLHYNQLGSFNFIISLCVEITWASIDQMYHTMCLDYVSDNVCTILIYLLIKMKNERTDIAYQMPSDLWCVLDLLYCGAYEYAKTLLLTCMRVKVFTLMQLHVQQILSKYSIKETRIQYMRSSCTAWSDLQI